MDATKWTSRLTVTPVTHNIGQVSYKGRYVLVKFFAVALALYSAIASVNAGHSTLFQPIGS